MTWAAAAATVGQTYMNARAADTEAKTQEALYKYNAQVKEDEARARAHAGAIASQRKREEGNRLISSMIADRAKRGVTSEGSPTAVLLKQAENNEMDALMTGYNYKIESTRARNEAQGYRYKAKSARQAGKLNVGAALFSGGSQLAGIFG